MYTPRQIWQHVTPKAQLLIALSLATVLAFSAGLAAGIYGRATYLPTLTADRNAVPAAAQPFRRPQQFSNDPRWRRRSLAPAQPMTGRRMWNISRVVRRHTTRTCRSAAPARPTTDGRSLRTRSGRIEQMRPIRFAPVARALWAISLA